MTRIKLRGTLVASAALVVTLAACGSGAAVPTATSGPGTSNTGTGSTPTTAGAGAGSGKAVVDETMNAKLGAILVTSKGLTLYRFTPDTATTSACNAGCAPIWPPLTVPAGTTTPTGATGITGLGTIRRSDGTVQVTYKGHPLYMYSGDTAAGQTNGQGLFGKWFALTVSSVTGSTTATTMPAASTSTSPSYSSGY